MNETKAGRVKKYVPTVDIIVKRHVGDLIVLVPVEDRDDVDRDDVDRGV